MRDTMLDGRDEDAFLRGAERVGPYLTLKAGRMYERMTIRWCTEVLAVLERRGAGAGRETASLRVRSVDLGERWGAPLRDVGQSECHVSPARLAGT